MKLPDYTVAYEFWDALAEWSNATFGDESTRGPVGPLKHLKKEAQEAIDAAGDKRAVEIADCLFLTFDAARRHGLTFNDLFAVAFAKLEANRQRVWPKPTSDEPVEHDRSKE